MIFAAAIPVGIVAGFLLGGRLEGLSALRFRWAPLAVGGLLAQIVLFSDLAAGLNAGMVALLYVATTAAVFVALLRNVRLTGLPIVAVGALSNLAAIVANGGIMPADAGALIVAGLEPRDGTDEQRRSRRPGPSAADRYLRDPGHDPAGQCIQHRRRPDRTRVGHRDRRRDAGGTRRRG